MEKSIPRAPAAAVDQHDESDVATRIARRTLAARGPDYSSEVRRLLDAGREVMRKNGTTSRARV
ncbi:MAG: TetR/AcrR family transcriptional regulator, partial [Acidimicrobiales bacterium]